VVSPLTSPNFTIALNQHQFNPSKSKEDNINKTRNDTSSQSRDGNSTKKPWMTKMEFPKFSGIDARVWLDGRVSYFVMYNVPASFRVTSATLHVDDWGCHALVSFV
jgi:hypothetical protein